MYQASLGVKRLVISVAMLALGVALGAAANALPGTRSAAAVREGGTFRIGQWASVRFVDPALSYSTAEWPLLEATCAKLMNYPDKPLPAGLRAVPEVAAGYRVSANGMKYTFMLRRGFRFSNGAKLTARSFLRAIERLLDPEMNSPAVDSRYVQDIVGADDVLARRASSPSGVVARGNRLVIRLERPIPDFAARLAMPFFCAVPPSLPANPEGIGAYASAGPYYVADFRPGQRLVLRRNRYYGGNRPVHVDGFVLDNTLPTPAKMVERIERGQADWGWMDASARQGRGPALVRKYGLNRSRLSIRPSPTLRFFVLNTERPLFRSARLRRAVNLAVNRVALANAHGFKVMQPTDQYLPIGFPGFRYARIYRLKGDVRRATALAGRRFRGAKAVLYTTTHPIALALAQIVKRNLARIGLGVEIKPFPFAVLLAKLSAPGEPFDIAWGIGWTADYSDPYAFLNLFFHGREIGKSNFARLNSPRYNHLLDRASRLSGAKRYRTYGKLDVALARNAAPFIAYGTDNAWTLVSKRVGCKILRPELDLAAVCLKR
jgi:ABC-type oligopeptide transport system substrate-binding subunit